MADTLFEALHYSVGDLIGAIDLGRIGPPYLQRPFVWADAKFESMCRGYRKLIGVAI